MFIAKLKDAGIYKNTEENGGAFLRFLAARIKKVACCNATGLFFKED